MFVRRLMQQAYLINGIMVRKVIRGINDFPTTPNQNLSQANGADLPTRNFIFAFK